MAITVSAPDAFFDLESWQFTLTVKQENGTTPLDLTGSRLFVAFCANGVATPVGSCDSAAGDGSLSIASGTGGVAIFTVTNVGRTWRAARGSAFGFVTPAQVTGDLYRLLPSVGAVWDAVCRITFPVLPSTGLPAS